MTLANKTSSHPFLSFLTDFFVAIVSLCADVGGAGASFWRLDFDCVNYDADI